jgi:hypothetical protein
MRSEAHRDDLRCPRSTLVRAYVYELLPRARWLKVLRVRDLKLRRLGS